jgi:hypothetical protein
MPTVCPYSVEYSGAVLIFQSTSCTHHGDLSVMLGIPPSFYSCKAGVIVIQWLTAAIVWIMQCSLYLHRIFSCSLTRPSIVILLFRINAMYNRSRKLLLGLAVAFAVEAVLMIWLVIANQLIFHGGLGYLLDRL